MSITPQQRHIIREQAGNCCEYCRLPQSGGTIPFHIDHIIPIKHDGLDITKNLCLACYKCNGYKGADIAGFDPETGDLTRLYHPRQQLWHIHFEIQPDMTITGKTPEGRTTVKVLRMNNEAQVENRQILAELGDYPCKEVID